MTNGHRIDVGTIWREVQANTARLIACPRHRFPDRTEFGQRWTCAACGGLLDAGDVLAYCRGFKAAGGDPRVIWAPFET